MKGVRIAVILALALAAIGLGAAICVLVVFPQMSPAPVERSKPGNVMVEATRDANLPTEQEEKAYVEAHKGRPKVNPLVAQCAGIDLRTPVAPADLTGILFHQASYDYALVLTTELPPADIEAIGRDNPAYMNNDQYEGTWLDGEAMHIWRTSDATDMDTSIDAGAPAGATVRSPVTGTVVLVRDYLLYNEVPDVEIHIQPEGRPDLDVVLIHTENPLVKAGDKVESGVTDIAHVRDIAASLTDVQLYFYTEGDDPGNHTHVQVNNADHPGYREKRLEGAISAS